MGFKIYDHSLNLFNANDMTDIINNSFINQSGSIISNSDYYISGLIEVEAGQTYCWNFGDQSDYHSSPTIGFYDGGGNLLSAASHSAAVRWFNFTVPSGASFVRASVWKYSSSGAMLSKGAGTKPYSPYVPDWSTYTPKIFNGTSWVNANAYVYTNGAWVQM